MESSVEQCPLCGTELSGIKFREIQSKLHEQERKRAADVEREALAARQRLEEKFKLDLEKRTKAAEKKAVEEAGQEVKKLAAERDRAAKKLKEVEGREAEIRRQAEQEIARQKQSAERKANEEAEAKIKKVAVERDQLAKKLKDSEDREADLLKQTKENSEKQLRKELAEQRQLLEKDKTLTLLRQETKFNRERESLQKKMQLMDKQLQRRTANELGDGAEIDLFEDLRESFPGDKITRIPKGQAGADILHEILYKGELCGKIILDSKNRQRWGWEFVTKLRQDQVEAGAEHSILATTVFPAGKKEMCIESDVIVMAPARIVYIVQILRQADGHNACKGLEHQRASHQDEQALQPNHLRIVLWEACRGEQARSGHRRAGSTGDKGPWQPLEKARRAVKAYPECLAGNGNGSRCDSRKQR
jgi:hypothetical protein